MKIVFWEKFWTIFPPCSIHSETGKNITIFVKSHILKFLNIYSCFDELICWSYKEFFLSCSGLFEESMFSSYVRSEQFQSLCSGYWGKVLYTLTLRDNAEKELVIFAKWMFRDSWTWLRYLSTWKYFALTYRD